MNARHISISILVLILLVASACSDRKGSGPKKTVFGLFGAMERNDKAALTALLDLPELMKSMNRDYALQTDKPREFTSPEQILDDLTGEGLTKKRWFSLQRIINTSAIDGETATVEVTFVDKKLSRSYRTRFGLNLENGKWRIFSFKTFQGAP